MLLAEIARRKRVLQDHGIGYEGGDQDKHDGSGIHEAAERAERDDFDRIDASPQQHPIDKSTFKRKTHDDGNGVSGEDKTYLVHHHRSKTPPSHSDKQRMVTILKGIRHLVTSFLDLTLEKDSFQDGEDVNSNILPQERQSDIISAPTGDSPFRQTEIQYNAPDEKRSQKQSRAIFPCAHQGEKNEKVSARMYFNAQKKKRKD